MSDEDITKLSSPRLRDNAAASNEQSKELFAMMEQSRRSFLEINETCRSIRESMNKFSIAQIEAIKQRVYKVPMEARISWWVLELWRVSVQLVVLGYIVGKVGEDLIHRGGKGLLSILKLEDKKGLLTALVLVVMLVIGKLIEKRIDKAEMKRYKAKLVLLLMERSQTIWTSYNALVQIERNAREGLETIQHAVEEQKREEKEQDKEDELFKARIEALKQSMVDSELKLRELQSMRSNKTPDSN